MCCNFEVLTCSGKSSEILIPQSVPFSCFLDYGCYCLCLWSLHKHAHEGLMSPCAQEHAHEALTRMCVVRVKLSSAWPLYRVMWPAPILVLILKFCQNQNKYLNLTGQFFNFKFNTNSLAEHFSSARPLIWFKNKTKTSLDLNILSRPRPVSCQVMRSLEFWDQDQESRWTLHQS